MAHQDAWNHKILDLTIEHMKELGNLKTFQHKYEHGMKYNDVNTSNPHVGPFKNP